MAGELVDLSLFATSPTFDDHFSISESPPQPSPPYLESPWTVIAPRSAYNEDLIRQQHMSCYREMSRSRSHETSAMKPLPPVPQRRLFRGRSDPRHDDPRYRCILNRMKRLGSGGEREPQTQTTIRERRNVTSPQLALSAPQQTTAAPASARTALPMIWLPDEQVWLVADETNPQAPHPSMYPPPPEYSPPRYARSEPSPRRTSADVSHPDNEVKEDDQSQVRSQFATLIPRKETSPTNHRMTGDERMSPLFQEAIAAVSMDHGSGATTLLYDPEPETEQAAIPSPRPDPGWPLPYNAPEVVPTSQPAIPELHSGRSFEYERHWQTTQPASSGNLTRDSWQTASTGTSWMSRGGSGSVRSVPLLQEEESWDFLHGRMVGGSAVY
ncbi:hypothetical protein MMC09_001844 [Bachmanniomyces sp. S44760]|nr:hypothetical protein [Bachmanniomyces sp. S44760]